MSDRPPADGPPSPPNTRGRGHVRQASITRPRTPPPPTAHQALEADLRRVLDAEPAPAPDPAPAPHDAPPSPPRPHLPPLPVPPVVGRPPAIGVTVVDAVPNDAVLNAADEDEKDGGDDARDHVIAEMRGGGAEPREFGGEPREFGGEPREFGGEPREFGGEPREFGGEPLEFGGEPLEFGGEPREFADEPREFAIPMPVRRPADEEFEAVRASRDGLSRDGARSAPASTCVSPMLVGRGSGERDGGEVDDGYVEDSEGHGEGSDGNGEEFDEDEIVPTPRGGPLETDGTRLLSGAGVDSSEGSEGSVRPPARRSPHRSASSVVASTRGEGAALGGYESPPPPAALTVSAAVAAAADAAREDAGGESGALLSHSALFDSGEGGSGYGAVDRDDGYEYLEGEGGDAYFESDVSGDKWMESLEDSFEQQSIDSRRAAAIIGSGSFAVFFVVLGVVLSGLTALFGGESRFEVTSDWMPGGEIPLKYGCLAPGGPVAAASIPLAFSNIPADTTSLVVLLAHPGGIKATNVDAVHWFVTGIPVRPHTSHVALEHTAWMIPVNASANPHLLPAGATQRPNTQYDDGHWSPLCAPGASPSLYMLYVYAADSEPKLANNYTDARQIMNRFTGVPCAKLAGTYGAPPAPASHRGSASADASPTGPLGKWR